MNKTAIILKEFGIKNLKIIYDIKTNYPELSDEELLQKIQEINPELAEKIIKFREEKNND